MGRAPSGDLCGPGPGARGAPPLPFSGERMDGVLQNQQPAALVRRKLQVLRSLAPAPQAQLLARRTLQAFAEQRSGCDAVRTAVHLETHGDDAILAHARAEIEAHPLLRIARGRRDDVRRRSETADVARLLEVLDHEGAIRRFAHD